MSFEVSAPAYRRFMGRFSEPLAEQLVTQLAPAPGTSALDVGCGPGALTTALVARLGPAAVRAVDPSASFVAAARAALPGVEVQQASAESLPVPDGAVDLTAAQLVVQFLPDPVAGLREMRRVTTSGGVVAASVWDDGGGRSPISPFWTAVRRINPATAGERGRPGTRAGHLAELFAQAGLRDITDTSLTVRSDFAGPQEWWEIFSLGVGPVGDHLATLDEDGRERLRQACAEVLPSGPFTIEATAWLAIGRV